MGCSQGVASSLGDPSAVMVGLPGGGPLLATFHPSARYKTACPDTTHVDI